MSEYVPTMPSSRNDIAGYWSVAFPDFKAATYHHAILYTHFGFEDPVEEAVKWAVKHGYRPDGYSPKQYDRSKIEDVKANNRIEDVAGRLTELRGNGKVLRGKCPLHGGSNRSAFTVYIETQSFYCFNCNAGGDVLDLAEKAGIELG